MFTVTRKWIFDNRTDAGAWTYDQLRCLGVSLPPRHGWIDQADGMQITDEARQRFERKLSKSEVKFGKVEQVGLL